MDAPNQPKNIKFPKRTFGIKNPEQRSFNPQWFISHPWLHYDETGDLAFCYICMAAKKSGKIGNTKIDASFISKGFSNWKDATKKFRTHEKSECHGEAVDRHVTLPKQTRDVGELLSSAHKQEKADNRAQFLQIIRSIRYLSRHGIALRGHEDSEGDFMQLLKHHSETDPSILTWIKKKQDKFTSPEIQNEILQIMALKILRKVSTSVIEDNFYTIMVDETTDASNREQVVLVLRHVDKDLTVQEEFIGLYMVDSIASSTITSVIKDTLMRMRLNLSNCRGQCYDGASNMSGAKKGVAMNILKEEPRALYTHCYGHALNLAVGDTVRKSKILRDTLITVHEISKLIKYSLKRDVTFEELKQQISPDGPGFRVLCPTRWTVRAASLKSVLDNYPVLQRLWEVAYENTKDTETRARIVGVKSQMMTFDFMFGVSLGYELLRHSDNLSKSLQQKDISASEGQDLATLTLATLHKLRSDEEFDRFWDSLDKQLDNVDVCEPTLPRRRKAPKRFETGNAPPEYPVSPKDLYRQHYFEAIDLATTGVKARFDQPGFQMYRHLQDCLLKRIVSDETAAEDLQKVVKLYKGDINETALTTQLESLRTFLQSKYDDLSKVTVSDVLEVIKSMKPSSRFIFSEIITLLKLILVMPATNATSERSFSALRRVKTYLRSTMSQQRLNHTMVIHVHKDATDDIDVVEVANEFVRGVEGRVTIFGQFQTM